MCSGTSSDGSATSDSGNSGKSRTISTAAESTPVPADAGADPAGVARRSSCMPVGHTALVLGDQLSHANPALDGAARVLLVESRAALTRLRYHRRRRHLVLSAMRHYARELEDRGIEVDHVRDAASLGPHVRRHGHVVCAEPNSDPSQRALRRLGVELVPSTQFLTDPEDFAAWARGRGGRRLVMEDFYRRQRRRFALLVDADGKPEGGRWN